MRSSSIEKGGFLLQFTPLEINIGEMTIVENLRILITGSDGSIGKELKKYFLKKKAQVHGTVYLKNPEENEVFLDIRNDNPRDKLGHQKFDIIIHTIGCLDQNAPQKILNEINADGTLKMLDYAEHFDCKHFSHISSISIYGPHSIGQLRKEGGFWENRSLLRYGKSKSLAE